MLPRGRLLDPLRGCNREHLSTKIFAIEINPKFDLYGLNENTNIHYGHKLNKSQQTSDKNIFEENKLILQK